MKNQSLKAKDTHVPAVNVGPVIKKRLLEKAKAKHLKLTDIARMALIKAASEEE